ncbi:MAG TPA: carboxymuconolactone decarboxylase family protein [Burkholderiaceae bacterium]|jgi:alkylhydroperoxidase/carboxymuconolactone decarboxylase family protein YurZ
MSNALLNSPLLRRIAPQTVGGYRRLRAVIDADSALPAKVKALYVAVAATTRRYPEMARRELSRGHGIGLTFEEASSAAIVLSSVRGEGAALDFIAALEAEYPGQTQGDAAEREIQVQPGDAEKNFLAYFGSMPPSLGRLLDLVPTGADAYYLLREGTINGTPLGPKYSELMLVTVIAADYNPLAAVHIKAARRVGASETEIAEALLCAVATSGLSAWVAGVASMDAP